MKIWRQLRWQLLISYFPVILLPVLMVGFVTRGAAEQGLTVMVSQGARQQADLLAQCFASYYAKHGSWSGLADVLKPPPRRLFTFFPPASEVASTPPITISVARGTWFDFKMNCYTSPAQQDRLMQTIPSSAQSSDSSSAARFWNNRDFNPSYAASRDKDKYDGPAGDTFVADIRGIVIASNNLKSVGQPLSASALAQGAPIVVGGKQVGTLAMGAAFAALEQQKRDMLETVNGALLVSGGMAVLLAVLLGWRLSWQIAQPVRELRAGVRRLSSGEWSSPLKVHSQNEFAELTEAFNAMANEVTRQQRLTRQMVADVAHDLRTPLSAMALEVEAIEAGFQTPAEATASLREEITWLQRLVDDLRLLSLMDADQIHLVTEPTPLNQFLNSVLDFWQIMATEEGRTLTLQAPENLPTVMIDPGRMRQVLGNLIDNAIRHTKPSGRIVLGASSDSTGVLMWVSDDGEGIAPADMPHVFDRFYRADRSRGRSKTGSGLGLSISRRLVEMHGGTIGVNSTPGYGATFTIKIPAIPTEPKEQSLRWVRTLEARQRGDKPSPSARNSAQPG
ncbi:MAG: HAMP domain-containing histidine kinase [Anaerolineae bacterium]|nr:HAMP domain-containing histidine kinase [Anaerolineae bacterium]